MKITGIVLALLVMAGCASAEQRSASKRDYRDSQVEAIRVQVEQQTARKSAEELSEAAMWQSLAQAVQANPDQASHFAIVMAVAAARGGESTASTGPIVTLKTEQSDAQSWAKILAAPLLNTFTQVGIAALNTDLQKEISRNNTQSNIVEAEQDGKIYSMVEQIMVNRADAGDTYNIADNAVLNTGSQDNDSTTTTTTTTTTTNITEDNDVIYGDVDPDTVPEPEPEPEPVLNCEDPQFSPSVDC